MPSLGSQTLDRDDVELAKALLADPSGWLDPGPVREFEDEFASWNPRMATDVLRRMRGIRLRPNPEYLFRGDGRKYLIETSRSAGRVQRNCPVLFFLNGVFHGDSDQDVDILFTIQDTEAIEVYSGASDLPPVFNRPGASCGVVAFWTR